MDREEVRRALPGDISTFYKWRAARPTDHFNSLGVHAHYDDRDALEAIEFGRPAQPILDGIDVLGVPLDRAKQLLRLKGGPLQDKGEDITSRSLGLALWAPSAGEEPDAPCEAIMISGPGYYDRHPAD
jgi:hypothetical protein